MRCLVFALAFVCAAVLPTRAQDAIPDLKGTWSGKGKSIVFGSHEHHPGSQTAADPPRVRDIEATHTVEGQDGRLAWGRSSSATAIPRSRSRGRLRATTRPSSERTWMAIFASRSSAPTGWRSATPTMARAQADRSSRPVTRWIV